ncbi:urea carboxylase [Noviherbaspirillum pedocola]|uniref:Urea carboxylase n=1 Tax=Noviherbaspirillum pedocola TaxID=2801341 RepID=A0A934SV48_9BURK|nr:urea carboxylase [Noviherbaspirillum pedocola]MBK4737145.1 urea carboxylase [Noviherbaspirillum pedocola]
MSAKVLIANRGAIACRIIRTLKRMGIPSVAVYSEADADALFVTQAEEAVAIGPAPAAQSYLQAARLIEAARATGATAIHPGYGFLSENAAFAEACAAAGIAFLGPTPEQMRVFGLKHTARALAEQSGLPLLPGTGLLSSFDEAASAARRIGYPVMLKSSAGGGGIGMQMCRDEDELSRAFDSVRRMAQANFSDAGVFLERYIEAARHIEVQIFGDGQGRVIALGERDCSLQRRNQKVIEETPAPNLPQPVRERLLAMAVRLAEAVQYRSAGTVEFVMDAKTHEFFFLEVNTRLQVEHGVTEAVTGIDLVEWMVRLGLGTMPPLQDIVIDPRGCAVQARVYAEDPAKGFLPSTGLLTEVVFPADVRVDSWIARGAEVTPYYDPMLAKIIAHADTREAALGKLGAALAATRIAGLESNLAYLHALTTYPPFLDATHTTRSLGDFMPPVATIDVIDGGVQTSVQDWPGRLGYWDVGMPPSGPMDALSFRLANRLIGNPEGTAGLEITVAGPTLSFNCDTEIALTGAPIEVLLDEAPLPMWQPVAVKRGQVLRIRRVTGAGCRAYLALAGGLDVPDYLGSKSTFSLGQLGGHGGRVLRGGDVLHLGGIEAMERIAPAAARDLAPKFGKHWDIAVLYGPHGAPDFFTGDDIAMFFGTDWQVHYNSSRTGVRLIGPKPQWARSDGGEAGLHPSNIHDNAYAIGTIDFTGDMPVILGPDGPSLGGFVCPATIVQAELWKMGQLAPGDTVRFHRVAHAEADRMLRAQNAAISGKPEAQPLTADCALSDDAIIHRLPPEDDKIEVVYRRSGDHYVLVEYGPLVLDLNLRFRVQALMTRLQQQRDAGALPGIIDMTPGIRSLQLHYDSSVLGLTALMKALLAVEEVLDHVDDIEVPTRTVWLPLSWDDAATRLAIEKYMQSVRADAPWCPSNIEFIRRINGLDGIDDVKRIVFDASYLVLGLGDVYLGAPVATPVDPRHRLVTTKYNPARTWTPENAVGIGGAYMCVYGMEGPGGYQFVGRTVQMWNRWRQTRDFTDGKPWLLRFFDQIRFYPMEAEALLQFRKDFLAGRAQLKIEEGSFRLADYNRFLADNAASIAAFKGTQQSAFDAERERWRAAGVSIVEDGGIAAAVQEEDVPADCDAVTSQVAGSIWKIAAAVGAKVKAGEALVIVESMKMEMNVVAPRDGEIVKIAVAEGQGVNAGQTLIVIR